MRVAFLICIENGLVYDNVWRQWLKYTPQHEYLVLVHARDVEALDADSFAAEHLVDVNITAKPELDADGKIKNIEQYVASRDNYDVHRLLLNKAVQHEEDTNPVTHFVFCDSDSIPVKSFTKVCAYLHKTSNGGEFSLIQFCPHQIKTEAGRKVLHMALVKYIHALREFPEFASQIPLTYWYWNSKFTIFARNHAIALCTDKKYLALLPQFKITNVCTHYPMLILSQQFPDELVNVPTTFEAWTENGDVRVYKELTEEMKPALRFENLLFASGISPESGIEACVEADLWDAEDEIDPKTGETAQYTGM